MTSNAIWFQHPNLAELNSTEHTLVGHLGIELTEIGDDFIKARMPVDRRTHQPMGLLHGGASLALAETLGSTGAYLCVDAAPLSRPILQRKGFRFVCETTPFRSPR